MKQWTSYFNSVTRTLNANWFLVKGVEEGLLWIDMRFTNQSVMQSFSIARNKLELCRAHTRAHIVQSIDLFSVHGYNFVNFREIENYAAYSDYRPPNFTGFSAEFLPVGYQCSSIRR